MGATGRTANAFGVSGERSEASPGSKRLKAAVQRLRTQNRSRANSTMSPQMTPNYDTKTTSTAAVAAETVKLPPLVAPQAHERSVDVVNDRIGCDGSGALATAPTRAELETRDTHASVVSLQRENAKLKEELRVATDVNYRRIMLWRTAMKELTNERAEVERMRLREKEWREMGYLPEGHACSRFTGADAVSEASAMSAARDEIQVRLASNVSTRELPESHVQL